MIPQVSHVDLYTEAGGNPFRAVCRGCSEVWCPDDSLEHYQEWLNRHRNHREEPRHAQEHQHQR